MSKGRSGAALVSAFAGSPGTGKPAGRSARSVARAPAVGGSTATQEQPVLDEDLDGSPAASAEPQPRPDLDVLGEEDLETDLPPLEDAPAEGRRAKAPSDREIEEGGGDSMLARYFREMATHNVMGQEEELATAIQVEKAEVDHWTSVLSHLPAAEYALESLERDLPTNPEEVLHLPQIAELRRLLKLAKKTKWKLSRISDKR